jgi:hypothetical protein
METASHHIYIIRTREFISLNQNVYKIGKTKQGIIKRYRQYPKGSSIEFTLPCKDCDTLERDIIKAFREKFIHKYQYGHEYFEGDLHEMIHCIHSLWATSPCGKCRQSNNETNEKGAQAIDDSDTKPVNNALELKDFISELANDFVNMEEWKVTNQEFYKKYTAWCKNNELEPRSKIVLGRDLAPFFKKDLITKVKFHNDFGKLLFLKKIREVAFSL